MSTFRLMNQAGYSSIDLGSDDHKVTIKLTHFSSGKWEIQRRTAPGVSPYLSTIRDLSASQAETLLNSYDMRGAG